jgi:DNA-binding transcriptional regulator YdaS (Cro superfamily)
VDLKTYLGELAPDQREEFAARCGTSAGHLKNIAYGYKPCGEALAISIDRETSGRVRCEDLRPDVDWAYLRGSDAAPSEHRT